MKEQPRINTSLFKFNTNFIFNHNQLPECRNSCLHFPRESTHFKWVLYNMYMDMCDKESFNRVDGTKTEHVDEKYCPETS